MKTTNNKSGKRTFSAIYIIAVLSTTMGFAQTEESSLHVKSNLSNTKSNPLYQDNQMTGENPSTSDAIIDAVQAINPKTKSTIANERTTRPNGQDDGNPFPPKTHSSKGRPMRATYDVKANKKV